MSCQRSALTGLTQHQRAQEAADGTLKRQPPGKRTRRRRTKRRPEGRGGAYASIWYEHLRAACDPHVPTHLSNLGSITPVLFQATPGQTPSGHKNILPRHRGSLPQPPSSVPGLLCQSTPCCFVTSVTSFPSPPVTFPLLLLYHEDSCVDSGGFFSCRQI